MWYQCFWKTMLLRKGISKLWWVYISKRRRKILVCVNKREFTIFILVGWIALSVFWKNKWICSMPATQRGRVTHICASKQDHPSLVQIVGQYWHIVKWFLRGNIQWNFNPKSSIFVQKHFKISSTKWLSFCFCPSVLDTHPLFLCVYISMSVEYACVCLQP